MSEVSDYWKPQLAKADATISRLSGIIATKNAEIEKLRAALVAQNEADNANAARVGYEKWQALEDRAKALRMAALER